jgi:hypothetical protein
VELYVLLGNILNLEALVWSGRRHNPKTVLRVCVSGRKLAAN